MTERSPRADQTAEPAGPRVDGARRVRWFHLLILFALIAEGAVLRFDRLGSDSLWLDEYWTLYLATGRDQFGHGILEIPTGVVLDPPPAMGFDGAPPWWTVCTSVASAGGNGPVFSVVLRWWVDLVGTDDFALRTLPTLFSLANVLLIFILVYPDFGPWPALLAASLMSLCVYSINFAKDLRSYPMIMFLGLCITGVIFSIIRKGPAWWRLALVGFLAFCLVLTHYFTFGALLGVAIFALWRMERRSRRRVLATLAISGLVTAALWGPMLRKAVASTAIVSSWMHNNPGSGPAESEPMLILAAPTRLISGFVRETLNYALSDWNPWTVVFINIILFLPLAWVTFGWPALSWKKERDPILYWWLWSLCAIGFVAIVDRAQHYYCMAYPRYYSIAMPGICVLVSAFAASRDRRWAMSISLLLALALMLRSLGPHIVSHDRRQWRQAAALINSIAGPDDILAFDMYDQDFAPRGGYCAYRHYVTDHRPLLLPIAPEPLFRSVANSGKMWVVGDNPTRSYYPGAWYAANIHWLGTNLYMWRAIPPPATMPSDTAK
jgi:4-amino-4-deoxy-L-arabinose transferase-like glycosyltransferase